MVFQMCEGIWSCSSFSVKELDVIVHKKYFPCIALLNFGRSVPHLTSDITWVIAAAMPNHYIKETFRLYSMPYSFCDVSCYIAPGVYI